ncbi:alpha/beta fold hydrolase [Litorivicinus lipolyticus]|uniref:alpha/beta fold hydrolase n=1 Tax=Litorivicinus lipolyticus TaxID=418701 RepID=UPI003B5BA80F
MTAPTPARRVYFLPGRGAALDGRLGTELAARGFEVIGRETRPPFSDLDYPSQVAHINADLDALGSSCRHIVAHSFGGYLALSALLTRTTFDGVVVLVSPVASNIRRGFNSWRLPANAKFWQAWARRTDRPLATYLWLGVGECDWQSPADINRRILSMGPGELLIQPGGGHELPAPFVQAMLDQAGIRRA